MEVIRVSSAGDAARNRAAEPVLPDGVWEELAAIASDRTPRAGGTLIDRAVFDAEAFPEPERAAAYQHLIAGSARMTPLADPIQVKAAWYTLGMARICLFENIPYRFERTRAKASFDRYDRVAIQHLYRGNAVGNFDGVPSSLAEGSVYGIDFSRPATIVEREPVRLILFGIERRAAAAVLPSLERLHGAVLDRGLASPYLRELYGLVPRLDTLRARDAPEAVAALLSALARCFPAEGARGADDRLAARRRLVMAHMEARIADAELSPASIAASLGLSRSALFLPFKDDGGVQRALLDLRLRRAGVLLSTPGPRPPVAQVAAACGFANIEVFSRQFRRRFGTAPSRYRDPVGLASTGAEPGGGG